MIYMGHVTYVWNLQCYFDGMFDKRQEKQYRYKISANDLIHADDQQHQSNVFSVLFSVTWGEKNIHTRWTN